MVGLGGAGVCAGDRLCRGVIALVGASGLSAMGSRNARERGIFRGGACSGTIRTTRSGDQSVANAVWPDLTGRAKASVTIEEPAAWLSFGQERDWFALPEKHSLDSGPLDGEVSAVFEQGELKDWESEWSTEQIDGSIRNVRLSAQNLKMSMRGEGPQVNDLEAAARDGTAGYEAMDLDFDRFNAASSGTEEIEFSLSKWELKGEPPVGGLGSISLSAGDLRLLVEGSWLVWRPEFSTEPLSANLFVAKGPFDFFSGLGSATGSLQMGAGLSADVRRRLTLSVGLLDSNLRASGINLKSKQMKASIQGALTGSLEGGVELAEGQLSWSDGAGLLKGLEGEVQLASLLPPATKGRQRFQFASVKQGDFKTESGRVAFSYQETPEKVGVHRAAQISKRAANGLWLQDAEGKWYRK